MFHCVRVKIAYGRTNSREGGQQNDAVTYENMSVSQAGEVRVSERSNKLVLKESVSRSSPVHP